MKIYLKNIKVWIQGLDNSSELTAWANYNKEYPQEYIAPKPHYYPKSQLRRLSPFSKVILHCLDMPQALTQSLPLVFASQHGDLDKTVKLIRNTVLSEDLSPTQFALSVHNATAGLFSIATRNMMATTTISAGGNTFIEGLVEACIQSQQENTSVIYCYCDFPVPEEYRHFETPMPPRCIAMIISTQKINDINLASINVTPQQNGSQSYEASVNFSLAFASNFYTKDNSVITSDNYELCLDDFLEKSLNENS